MSVTDQTKSKMQTAVEHFKQELKQLRSNRANPAILENVSVEVYGAHMRIKELANITAPEARQIVITPFDPQTTGAIAKGIEKANLNLMPLVEGHLIRINIPPMDEAMRKEIAKQAKKRAEDAKVIIREIRRKGNEHIRKQKADSEVTEDVMKKTEKSIQDFTDQYCKEIDQLFTVKEREIMTV
jgi:ribosome recycling factor